MSFVWRRASASFALSGNTKAVGQVHCMAILSLVDEGRVINDAQQIRDYLAQAGIQNEKWDLILGLDENASSEDILAGYSERIERVKTEGGYIKVDVVNVNPSTPGLDAMLAKFNTEHWHDEDEVRFTVHGRGIYHVHPISGPILKLEVQPGDMIRVPRGTLHWFDLCGEREIKAVRFFQDPAGWQPFYTGSSLEKQYEPVCFGRTYFPHDEPGAIRLQEV